MTPTCVMSRSIGDIAAPGHRAGLGKRPQMPCIVTARERWRRAFGIVQRQNRPTSDGSGLGLVVGAPISRKLTFLPLNRLKCLR